MNKYSQSIFAALIPLLVLASSVSMAASDPSKEGNSSSTGNESDYKSDFNPQLLRERRADAILESQKGEEQEKALQAKRDPAESATQDRALHLHEAFRNPPDRGMGR